MQFTKEQTAGYIYILTCPVYKLAGICKIGYADDPKSRAKQLASDTSFPDDKLTIYATFPVAQRLVDLKVHSIIDFINPDLRYNESKEFYIMSCEQAFDTIQRLADLGGIIGDGTKEAADEEAEDEVKRVTNVINKSYYNEELFNPILEALGLPTGRENIAKCDSDKIYLKDSINNGEYKVTSIPAFLEDKGFNARLKMKASKRCIKVYFGTWSIRKDLTINSYSALDQMKAICEKYNRLNLYTSNRDIEAYIEVPVKNVESLDSNEIEQLKEVFEYVHKAARGE